MSSKTDVVSLRVPLSTLIPILRAQMRSGTLPYSKADCLRRIITHYAELLGLQPEPLTPEALAFWRSLGRPLGIIDTPTAPTTTDFPSFYQLYRAQGLAPLQIISAYRLTAAELAPDQATLIALAAKLETELSTTNAAPAPTPAAPRDLKTFAAYCESTSRFTTTTIADLATEFINLNPTASFSDTFTYLNDFATYNGLMTPEVRKLNQLLKPLDTQD